ncbi:hypothetical protein AAFA46_08440 [Oscillospiraceae bacterium WX1]
MASAKTMQAIIEIAGSLSPSLESAIQNAVGALDSLKDGVMASASSYEKLEVEMDAQEKALRALKKQYASFVIDQNQSSAEAKGLKKQIDAVNAEYINNKRRLREAEDATDRWSAAVKNAGEGLDTWDIALGSLVAGGIETLISKVGESISSIAGLAKETREFRQDQGTLETAFSKAGYSAETATQTWENLYSVFGEDDRAVEAANNIARIAQNQGDLSKWVTITTGVWGTYQDALPVESLAEAAAETANTGQVTGTLADALNWSSEAATMFASYMGGDVTTAEDAFNAALADCNTTQERQQLITETLTSLYGDAAGQYETTAASIMGANKATADMQLAQAALGQTMEPVMTAINEGMTGLLQTALNLAGGMDMSEVVDGVAKAFNGLQSVIAWGISNWPTLAAILGTITTAIVANKVATVASTAVESANIAVKEGSTVAQWALNAAIDAAGGPIGAIILVIGLLVSAFVYLWNNSEGFRQFWIGLWDGITNAVSVAIAGIVGAWESIKVAFSAFGAWVQGLWQGIVDSISAIWGGIVDVIKMPINGIITLLNWFIDKINTISIGPLPDWDILGEYAGATVGFNIAHIAYLASGGFTDGISIAGEAGTEAVISFDPSVRGRNIEIWQQAGQMLGADTSLTAQAGKLLRLDDFSLSDYSGGNTYIVNYDLSGTVYSPSFQTGGSDDIDIMAKLKANEAEFFDWFDEFIRIRETECYV